GLSRANDGKPDTWVFEGPDGTVARMEISTHHDGKVNRTEFFEKGSLTRAEEDTDGDGKVDKWEVYEGGSVARVSFDTKHTGSPDTVIDYRAPASSGSR